MTITFNSMINTLFSGNEIPKERIHYVCIPAVFIDSLLRVDKKNYPQVYLELCEYKMKKRELINIIDGQVDLSSDDDSDNDSNNTLISLGGLLVREIIRILLMITDNQK